MHWRSFTWLASAILEKTDANQTQVLLFTFATVHLECFTVLHLFFFSAEKTIRFSHKFLLYPHSYEWEGFLC